MSVEVYISVILREACGGKSQFQIEAETISDIVDVIDSDYPGFRKKVLTQEGAICDGVRISVNGEGTTVFAGAQTRVQQGDHVFFLVAIAGG